MRDILLKQPLSYFTGTIVTVRDPKKKYTKFDKIGQG